MGYPITTQEQANDYMHWWLETINIRIAHKEPAKTLNDYPEGKAAFEKMKAAWQASFEDQGSIEKMQARDSMMIALSNVLKEISKKK